MTYLKVLTVITEERPLKIQSHLIYNQSCDSICQSLYPEKPVISLLESKQQPSFPFDPTSPGSTEKGNTVMPPTARNIW